MTIMIAAMALAAAQGPAAVQAPAAAPPPVRAQHAQPPAKPAREGCSCCKMAEGGKMACCAEHGKGHDGGQAEHRGHH